MTFTPDPNTVYVSVQLHMKAGTVVHAWVEMPRKLFDKKVNNAPILSDHQLTMHADNISVLIDRFKSNQLNRSLEKTFLSSVTAIVINEARDMKRDWLIGVQDLTLLFSPSKTGPGYKYTLLNELAPLDDEFDAAEADEAAAHPEEGEEP